MKERGTQAGLRQALREMRRERDRAAPRERKSHVSGRPKNPTIYRGGEGAAPPFRVPPQGVRPALDASRGAARGGERGGAP